MSNASTGSSSQHFRRPPGVGHFWPRCGGNTTSWSVAFPSAPDERASIRQNPEQGRTDGTRQDRDLERGPRPCSRSVPSWPTSISWSSASTTTTRCSTAGVCTGAPTWPTATSTATTSSAVCTVGTMCSTRGCPSYNNAERLAKFSSWLEGDDLMVDAEEIRALDQVEPAAVRPRAPIRVPIKTPTVIRPSPTSGSSGGWPNEGLEYLGHHGPVTSMGVSREQLPKWDDIQFVTAQLARKPQLDDAPVETGVLIGPNADRPLHLDIPMFVSDMSYGALSEEAKVALVAWRGDGRHRHLFRVRAACFPRSRRRTPATSTSWRLVVSVGTSTRSAPRTTAACRRSTSSSARAPRPAPVVTCPASRSRARSPRCGASSRAPTRSRRRRSPTCSSRTTTGRSPTRCGRRRAVSRSGPSSRLNTSRTTSTPRLRIGVDYIILDGRGGGTGAAPVVFRDHISVPTIPALARARRHLDARGRRDVTLVITGGLRTHTDFAKALALGADAVAVSNSAMQAIGCIGMRACSTNNCPGRDRDPEGGAAGPAPGAGGRGAAPSFLRGEHRADGCARAGVRPHPSRASSARTT